MEIQTTRFGKITFDKSGIIKFSEGLPGFINQKCYVILEVAEYAPLKWLQSIEEAWLAFVILDPLTLLDNYNIDIGRNTMAELGLSSSEKAAIYVIVTASETPQGATANLQAPIVINAAARLAKQIILTNSSHSTDTLSLSTRRRYYECGVSMN